jgi:hypothetical protein
MLNASHFIEVMHVNAMYAGNISHIERLGQHAIVLNSIKTTMNVLDKKASLYSDRPVFSMAGELIGRKDLCLSSLMETAFAGTVSSPHHWQSHRHKSLLSGGGD